MTGFQKLLCLGLDRTPARDVIAGTVAAWLEVLSRRPYEQQRDTPRIRAAFSKLLEDRTTWPLPADFLAAMPRATSQANPGSGTRFVQRMSSDAHCTNGLRSLGAVMGEMRLTYERNGEPK